MLLVLDIGNTNIVAGVYRGSRLLHSWRIASDRLKTRDEYVALLTDLFAQAKLKPKTIKASILASVVPPLVLVLSDALKGLCGAAPMVVSPQLDLGLAIRTRVPEEVGADRLVNAVAGFAAFGGPLLIIDFGTATTVDAIDHRGAYLGGAIAPGIGISLEALVSRTAKLPRIEMAVPQNPIGDSTLESMRSGLYYATLGGIKELMAQLGRELKRRDGRQPKVLATGGLSYWLPTRELGIHAVLPDLTLEGLRLIYERNRLTRRPTPRSVRARSPRPARRKRP
jgi:type III pantothenate kinase